MSENCSKFYDMMYPYLDGELSQPLRDELERHIKECPECALELEQRKKAIELTSLASYKPKKPLPETVTAVLKSFSLRSRSIRIGSTVAACFVLVACLSVYGVSKLLANKTADSSASELAPAVYDAEGQNDTGEEMAGDSDGLMLFSMDDVCENDAEDDVTGAAETEAADEESVEAEPGLKATLTVNPESAAYDSLSRYAELYAPDYAGLLYCAAITKNAAPDDSVLLSEAANYKVYLLPYSDEKRDIVKASISESDTFVCLGDSYDGGDMYILYVMLTTTTP